MIQIQNAFEIKLESANWMKKLLESITAIIKETRIYVSENGIELKCMDESRICLVYLRLDKNDMKDYHFTQKFEIGVNFEDLVKFFKNVNSKKEYSVKLRYDSQKDEKNLYLEMIPEDVKRVHQFKMALIDIDAEEIDMDSVNSMQFDNSCKISFELLDDAIKQAEILSEVLQLKVNEKNNLVFLSEGEVGEWNEEIERDELIDYSFNRESEGSFAIQFLKSILKSNTLTKTYQLQFKSEAPLKISLKLLEYSSLTYYLAPRVEEDSEREEEEAETKPKSDQTTQTQTPTPNLFATFKPIAALQARIKLFANSTLDTLKQSLILKKNTLTTYQNQITENKAKILQIKEATLKEDIDDKQLSYLLTNLKGFLKENNQLSDLIAKEQSLYDEYLHDQSDLQSYLQ